MVSPKLLMLVLALVLQQRHVLENRAPRRTKSMLAECVALPAGRVDRHKMHDLAEAAATLETDIEDAESTLLIEADLRRVAIALKLAKQQISNRSEFGMVSAADLGDSLIKIASLMDSLQKLAGPPGDEAAKARDAKTQSDISSNLHNGTDWLKTSRAIFGGSYSPTCAQIAGFARPPNSADDAK